MRGGEGGGGLWGFRVWGLGFDDFERVFGGGKLVANSFEASEGEAYRAFAGCCGSVPKPSAPYKRLEEQSESQITLNPKPKTP